MTSPTIVASVASSLRHGVSVVDRLPKAVSLRRGAYGRSVRDGIDAFLSERSAVERERVLRGVVRHRLVNRSIHRAHAALPSLARHMATRVPVVGRHRAVLQDAPGPLIIATGHFGPLFFALEVLAPRLRGRRVIVVLREGAHYLRTVVPLVGSLGFAYVLDVPNPIRRLARELRSDPSTVVIVAFDHALSGKRHVEFLGSRIATSHGMAYLADATGATIATTYWLWRDALPRLTFDDVFTIDRGLEPTVRRDRIVADVYGALERYVRAAPEQWSGWDHVARGATAPTILRPERDPSRA